MCLRTCQQLEHIGYRCVAVEIKDGFSATQNRQQSSWEKSLISSIWNALSLTDPLTMLQWLEATVRLSSRQRLEHFTRDLIFPELRENSLVIFIDEIERLFEMPSAICDLLVWIEKCYSLQDNYGEYQSLTFILLGYTDLAFLLNKVRVSLFDSKKDKDWMAENVAIDQLLSAAMKIAYAAATVSLSSCRIR